MSDDEAFGAASIAGAIFRFSLTRLGVCTVILMASAYSLWLQPKQLAVIHAIAGFGYSLIIWFALFLVNITAVLGDVAAAFVMEKIQEKIKMPAPVHRLLYFALSLCGFALAALFVSLGDDPIERYHDNLEQ